VSGFLAGQRCGRALVSSVVITLLALRYWFNASAIRAFALIRSSMDPCARSTAWATVARWCVQTKRTDEPPEGVRRSFHAAPFQRVKVPSG